MELGLSNKTVLVTAASKGLGYATALAFAKEGAQVMLASRSEQNLRVAVNNIQEQTGNEHVAFFAADMSCTDQIDGLFVHTERVFGEVDVLVNNAGGPPAGDFMSTDEAKWMQAYQLSLMSVVRASRRAIPGMSAHGWGRIVNFTSSSMKQPIENLILSNTFRTGVAGLSKSLALELGKFGILVNAIGAGRIATDRVRELDTLRATATGESIAAVQKAFEHQIPLKRYGTPDEFAQFAVFLCSKANGYITGQSVLVDGGLVRGL